MRGFIDGEYQDGELRGCTFLAGERGMGKTTEMARLLAQCGGGVAFFDSTAKHEALLRGYTTVRQPGELKAFLARNAKRRFRLRYVPKLNMFGEADVDEVAHLRAFCTVVSAYGNMVVGIDEIDLYCGAEWGKRGMPIELYKVAHMGRHFPLAALVTARDPTTLSIHFRTQCATMRLFRQCEDRYVQYFAGRIGKANAARLPHLERFRFLLWQAGTAGVKELGGRRPRP